MDDCRFLMSGWDRKNYYSERKGRSAKPAPDYDGWAVPATQRNNAVDRLLADLEMDEFKVEYVVPPESTEDEEIAEWLGTHDASWHRAWYASLQDHLVGRTLQRLKRLPVVRTRSGEYRPAAECRFATDGEAPEGVAIVDPDTYFLDGVIDDVVKDVLQRLGVREIDDESKFKGILAKYYGRPGRQPEWEEHRRHVETFIDFVQREQDVLAELESRSRSLAGSSRLWADLRDSQTRLKATRKALAGSRFLLSRDGQWLQPDRVYAGGDSPNSPASYYRCRARLPRVGHYHMRPSRRELDSRYRAIPRFDEFARTVGVVYEIPVRQAKCERNPEFRRLESGGGSQWTHRGTDRDWKAPDRLGIVLEWLEQGTADLESERENLARAIHAALDETRNDTWPPPGSCRWEDGDVSGKLVAVYRRNTAAEFRTAPSQFVFTLRRHAWVPQKLRAWYEEFARSSLCQVSECKGRSFRLRDRNWYFEAVRFLRLGRMIAADYVALCPATPRCSSTRMSRGTTSSERSRRYARQGTAPGK